MHGTCENDTYIQFHFPLPFALLEIPEKYHISDFTYVFQEAEWQFFFLINIFLSPVVWALLSGNLPICQFCSPSMTSFQFNTHKHLRHFTEILQLHAFSVFLSCYLRIRRLLFNALKQLKLSKFPRGKLKPLEVEIYLLNQKSAIRSP